MAFGVAVSAGTGVAEGTFPGQNGWIAAVRSANENELADLWIIRPDGTQARRLTNTPDDHERWPSFSPNGRRIVYSIYPDGGIFTVRVKGSPVRRIGKASGAGRDMDPAYSPSGHRIVFVHRTHSGGRESQTLFTMRSNGTRVRRVLPSSYKRWYGAPDWSSTGRIAFESADGAIYTVNADGSDPRRATPPRLDAIDPSWSPDGHRILFHTAIGPDSAPYSIGAGGRGLHRIGGENAWKLSSLGVYSPNGRRLLLFDGADDQLVSTTLNGGDITTLTNTGESEFAWGPRTRQQARDH
jgi:TolB protein